jgi:hypothetical protein
MKIVQQPNDESSAIIRCNDLQILQRQFSDLPSALQSSVQWPEIFWQSQQAAIQTRIASGNKAPLLSVGAVAQACALALLLFTLALLSTGPSAVPVPAQAQFSTDPDQELLVAIEQAVQSDGPASLEPAALLAEQIANPVQNSSSSQFTKESPNENE